MLYDNINMGNHLTYQCLPSLLSPRLFGDRMWSPQLGTQAVRKAHPLLCPECRISSRDALSRIDHVHGARHARCRRITNFNRPHYLGMLFAHLLSEI